jgi:hypothetical protein
MRFKNDTEHPLQELPISQMTDGADGLASACWSIPSLVELSPNAAADRLQYRKKLRRLIDDMEEPQLLKIFQARNCGGFESQRLKVAASDEHEIHPVYLREIHAGHSIWTGNTSRTTAVTIRHVH